MDSEEEGILTVSCAGGMTAMMDLPVRRSEVMGEQMEVTISGLAGGHSGTEIHKNRANSNILAGRFLYELAGKMDYALIELEGGLKRQRHSADNPHASCHRRRRERDLKKRKHHASPKIFAESTAEQMTVLPLR